MSRKTVNNLFFLLGVVAVAIMLCTFDMNYAQLWGHLQRAGWWFFAVMGTWLVIYLFNALSWHALIHSDGRVSVGFWRIYKLTISGFALNYATPMGLMGGEPYRIMELAPQIGTARATSSVILYVMMHIFSHICFWLGSIALYVVCQPVDWAMGLLLFTTAVVLGLGVWFFIKGYRKGMVVKTFRLLGRIPGVRGWAQRFYAAKQEVLCRIDSQIAELHAKWRSVFYHAFAWEFTARLLTSVEIYFILKILTPDVNLLHCIYIMAFTSLFANIFFFSPMQLGAREGGFALAVSGLVLPAAFGVYTGLISRVREILWIIIGLLLMRMGNRPSPARRPRAYLFDYGGTLDSGGRHWGHVLWQGYREALPDQPETMPEWFRQAYVHAERQLARQPIIQPEDDFHTLLLKKIRIEVAHAVEHGALTLDAAASEALAHRVADYGDALARHHTAQSRLILDQLRLHAPCALVSNFYGNLSSVLRNYGLDNVFVSLTESAVCGVRKPDPAIFDLALQQLNAATGQNFRPEDVCVVGDSIDKDLLPAQSFGMQTIWLQSQPWQATPIPPTWPKTITTLAEIFPA